MINKAEYGLWAGPITVNKTVRTGSTLRLHNSLVSYNILVFQSLRQSDVMAYGLLFLCLYMATPEEPHPRSPVLVEPLFGYSEGGDTPHTPTYKEAVVEWIDTMNFIEHPARSLITVNFCYHFLSGVVFIYFILNHLSLAGLFFTVASVYFLITIYNTLWYHRYCAHSAFTFQKPFYALTFLWTNPLVFREESYTIPHRVHHQRTEKSGDPYGPHLGWLASYLAVESSQKVNTDITEEEYESLKRSVSHIGFKVNTYNQFKQTGSVENVIHYGVRVAFAQFFWIMVFLYLGLGHLIMAWYASIFAASFLIRDFNWHGHGGFFRRKKKPGWEFDTNSHALNQHFYGYLASEWHDNHHKYPSSANNGFLPGQIDVTFKIIKFLWNFGMIASYIDSFPMFKKDVEPSY